MDQRVVLVNTDPVSRVVPTAIRSLRIPTQVIRHNAYRERNRTYRTVTNASPAIIPYVGHHLNTEGITIPTAHTIV